MRARVPALPLALGCMALACGGRVEDGFTPSRPSSASPGGSRDPSGPTSGPGNAQSALSELAAEVALAYCEAFGACCSASGQPPIDRARCESVVASAIVREVGRAARRATAAQIAACAAAVRGRSARCPKEDAPWPRYGGATPALFLPTSVYSACASLVGAKPESAAPACGASGSSCPRGTSCAIDSCVDVAPVGAACDGASSCIDSAVCAPSLACEPPKRGKEGEPCARDGCEAGLVCAASTCAPAREHPDITYVERESPYSVRAETCRRFDYL
jgi:hypothetical protein